MAYTKKAEIADAVKGAWVEFGTFTLNPASLAAATKVGVAVTVSGVKAGDSVFVNPQDLDYGIVVTGAKVTADNEVTVYINNTYDATTAVDGADKTYDILILHKVSGL